MDRSEQDQRVSPTVLSEDMNLADQLVSGVYPETSRALGAAAELRPIPKMWPGPQAPTTP